jgi:hypothetical protein
VPPADSRSVIPPIVWAITAARRSAAIPAVVSAVEDSIESLG